MATTTYLSLFSPPEVRASISLHHKLSSGTVGSDFSVGSGSVLSAPGSKWYGEYTNTINCGFGIASDGNKKSVREKRVNKGVPVPPSMLRELGLHTVETGREDIQKEIAVADAVRLALEKQRNDARDCRIEGAVNDLMGSVAFLATEYDAWTELYNSTYASTLVGADAIRKAWDKAEPIRKQLSVLREDIDLLESEERAKELYQSEITQCSKKVCGMKVGVNHPFPGLNGWFGTPYVPVGKLEEIMAKLGLDAEPLIMTHTLVAQKSGTEGSADSQPCRKDQAVEGSLKVLLEGATGEGKFGETQVEEPPELPCKAQEDEGRDPNGSGNTENSSKHNHEIALAQEGGQPPPEEATEPTAASLEAVAALDELTQTRDRLGVKKQRLIEATSQAKKFLAQPPRPEIASSIERLRRRLTAYQAELDCLAKNISKEQSELQRTNTVEAKKYRSLSASTKRFSTATEGLIQTLDGAENEQRRKHEETKTSKRRGKLKSPGLIDLVLQPKPQIKLRRKVFVGLPSPDRQDVDHFRSFVPSLASSEARTVRAEGVGESKHGSFTAEDEELSESEGTAKETTDGKEFGSEPDAIMPLAEPDIFVAQAEEGSDGSWEADNAEGLKEGQDTEPARQEDDSNMMTHSTEPPPRPITGFSHNAEENEDRMITEDAEEPSERQNPSSTADAYRISMRKTRAQTLAAVIQFARTGDDGCEIAGPDTLVEPDIGQPLTAEAGLGFEERMINHLHIEGLRYWHQQQDMIVQVKWLEYYLSQSPQEQTGPILEAQIVELLDFFCKICELGTDIAGLRGFERLSDNIGDMFGEVSAVMRSLLYAEHEQKRRQATAKTQPQLPIGIETQQLLRPNAAVLNTRRDSGYFDLSPDREEFTAFMWNQEEFA